MLLAALDFNVLRYTIPWTNHVSRYLQVADLKSSRYTGPSIKIQCYPTMSKNSRPVDGQQQTMIVGYRHTPLHKVTSIGIFHVR
jgi:hypothetical protein